MRRQPDELQAVLEQPQEPVVPRELRGLGAADVALVGECDERGKCRDLPHLVVVLPVHELQQLDRELDVAQSAGAELQLDVDARPGGMCAVTRSRIRCTDSTKFSRDALDQTRGATPST